MQKEKKDGYTWDIKEFFETAQECTGWQSTWAQLWLHCEQCIWSKWISNYIPIVSNTFPNNLYYFLLLYFNSISNILRINKSLHLLKTFEVVHLKYLSDLVLQTQTEIYPNSETVVSSETEKHNIQAEFGSTSVLHIITYTPMTDVQAIDWWGQNSLYHSRQVFKKSSYPTAFHGEGTSWLSWTQFLLLFWQGMFNWGKKK